MTKIHEEVGLHWVWCVLFWCLPNPGTSTYFLKFSCRAYYVSLIESSLFQSLGAPTRHSYSLFHQNFLYHLILWLSQFLCYKIFWPWFLVAHLGLFSYDFQFTNVEDDASLVLAWYFGRSKRGIFNSPTEGWNHFLDWRKSKSGWNSVWITTWERPERVDLCRA